MDVETISPLGNMSVNYLDSINVPYNLLLGMGAWVCVCANCSTTGKKIYKTNFICIHFQLIKSVDVPEMNGAW